MALLLRLDRKLRLKTNTTKKAMYSVFQRKLLGYSFLAASSVAIKHQADDKSLAVFEQLLQRLTHRSVCIRLEQVIRQMQICVF